MTGADEQGIDLEALAALVAARMPTLGADRPAGWVADPIPPGEPVQVIAAIAAVRAELPGIGKNQRMDSPSGHYDYRGIEDVTAEIGPLLGRHGIVPIPRVLRRTVAEMQINGRPWTEDTMTVEYVLYGPGGPRDYVVAGPFVTIARDNADKGTNKGLTQAFKQCLLQVWCVGDNRDDPDSYASQDRDRETHAQARARWMVEAGWGQEAAHTEAVRAVKDALAARVEADDLARDEANALWRDYAHPDGPDADRRDRTRAEHDAWTAAHPAARPETAPPADGPDQPTAAPDADTASSPPQAPRSPSEAPGPDAEPDTAEAPPDGADGPTAAEAPAPTGIDGLIEWAKALTSEQLDVELTRRGQPVTGNEDTRRARLVKAAADQIAPTAPTGRSRR